MGSRVKLSKMWFIPLTAIIAYFVPIIHAQATNYGSGTYGTCQYSTCGITLSTNGPVDISVVPTPGGKCYINKDSASVFTDNSNVYTLTLSSTTSSIDLVNGSFTIPTTTGTPSTPVNLIITT